jgi:quercetin dioxygenase-like cupin family protein
MTVDVRALASSGSGIVWSHASEDLNLNLMVLDPGAEVAEHINTEVDVLLVAVEGQSAISIDGREESIQAGGLALIPRGARRSIRAGAERFAYLTCHRRRRGLWPAPPQRPQR